MKTKHFTSINLFLLTLTSLLLITCLLACSSNTKQVKETQKSSEMNYEMGLNYFNNNEPALAIRALTIALEENPQNADAHHLLGFILMGRKNYTQAIQHFKTALEIKPNMLTCKNNLGVAYLFLNQWESAADIFLQLTKAPLYTSPWLAFANLGWANYKMGKLKTAIENTEMAIFLNPQMCLASNNLGIMYEELKQPDTALKHLNNAVKECKTYAEPHLHLAIIYYQKGQGQKAMTHLQKCTDLGPQTEIAERCREYMNNLY